MKLLRQHPFSPTYPCHFGGNGNPLLITVDLTVLPNCHRTQLAEHILKISEIHLDPTCLTEAALKDCVYHVVKIKELVSQEDQVRLNEALISFFQQLIDLNPLPLQSGQMGFRYDAPRANYLDGILKYMNYRLIKNSIAAENTIELSTDIREENFHTYFPQSDLESFPLRLEDYEQWEKWSKNVPIHHLSEYLKNILVQIEQLDDSIKANNIGRQIQQLWHHIEERSQSLIAISMLKDLADQCVNQSPPSKTPHVHAPDELRALKIAAFTLAYELIYNEKKLEKFESDLIDLISGKNKQEQIQLIQELKIYIENKAPVNSPSAQQLKKYIDRIEARLVEPCPWRIAEPIHTMQRDYNQQHPSPRQQLKKEFINKFEQTIHQHPFRSTQFWYKEAYNSADMTSKHRRLINEPYNPSMFYRHRFKEFISILHEEEQFNPPPSGP